MRPRGLTPYCVPLWGVSAYSGTVFGELFRPRSGCTTQSKTHTTTDSTTHSTAQKTTRRYGQPVGLRRAPLGRSYRNNRNVGYPILSIEVHIKNRRSLLIVGGCERGRRYRSIPDCGTAQNSESQPFGEQRIKQNCFLYLATRGAHSYGRVLVSACCLAPQR